MALSLKQLELLKYTLEEAEHTNTGAGQWLPETYAKNLKRSLNLVKKEIRLIKREQNVKT